MTETRILVVNADDFGFSDGVSRAIVHAHRHGIVTSTSLMVRMPGAARAVAMSRECPDLEIGLHLDLGEWEFDHGEWITVYEVTRTDDDLAVTHEVERQLNAFRALMGREPTHIDSHQHVHLRPIVRPIVEHAANALGIPLRHVTPRIAYCGRFYGQTTEGTSLPESISVEALLGILGTLPLGVTELACHPGEGDDSNTMYRMERRLEREVLCDPRIRKALTAQSIVLSAFSRLAMLP